MRINSNQPNTRQPRFVIGRDREGCWIVRDRLDRVGGLFASEHAAHHFAFEVAHRDNALICSTSDLVELCVGSNGEESIH